VNRKRVARVMRAAGIAGYRRRGRVKTTQPDPSEQKVPDLFGRDFTAATPNSKYVLAYLPLATGANLYLATVIDCCSRRATGWAIADHMRTELVANALKAADALRWSGRRKIPFRQRNTVYVKGFRETLYRSRGDPVDGCGGNECR
jgi:transposase InsO family protein